MKGQHLDEYYMRQALDLAAKARGDTSPNPMVGALVVRDGVVVGSGYHERAGTPHAEIHALRAAGEMAKGATLYVTLEPCCHHGRTPPCVDSVIAAGIKRVVAAMVDPNPKVAGNGLDSLRRAGIEVTVGVLAGQAARLNEVFVKHITTGLPFVLLKMAMTMDGKIATRTGDSRWITGEEARRRVHQLRREYDAVLVGVGTVLEDDPRLTVRLVDGRDPARVVLDAHARTPPTARIVRNDSRAPAIIVAGERAPESRVRDLRACGAEVWILPESRGRIVWRRLLEELGRRELPSLLIEGGAEVAASALASRIVDKVAFFMAPKIAGGRTAPGPVGGPGILRMADALPVSGVDVQRVGDDILIEGYLEVAHVHGSR
ncbi:MAG: bifunctional diaminohydroxyphosphoribosylaminopyrimidine deaminase/5-amino-6-(5-phosphoribosylamino)uracil reductase RibD [Firmicutes bacterium]|nr:bifunctional diaminohydroxyphosphoribosylaminopyrimidine deaminase/5-amino-6-(5-phosphoribosylamino)uracil reductase RibD [Bacillota bacterium]